MAKLNGPAHPRGLTMTDPITGYRAHPTRDEFRDYTSAHKQQF